MLICKVYTAWCGRIKAHYVWIIILAKVCLKTTHCSEALDAAK